MAAPLELVEPFGTMPDGRAVQRVTLDDGEGLTLRVLDYGATVQELWVDDSASGPANVVLGAPDLDGYLRSHRDFYGGLIGRYANRIARAELPIRGVTHHLATDGGQHTLHGGPDGFHRRMWQIEELDSGSVTLGLISPAGDQGFPGELRVRVTYAVRRGEVLITYSATTTEPTAVSLTQHAHFNLAGEGVGTVADHRLTVHASAYTPVDDSLIPLGNHARVDGTPFDLRRPTRIAERVEAAHSQIALAGGLDHNFVLDPAAGRPAATLSDPGSGRVLDLFTDCSGLQVYTGNFFDGTHVGTSGAAYVRHAGVALETQAFPDSPHHEGETGWPSVILDPGDTYRTATRWSFRPGTVPVS